MPSTTLIGGMRCAGKSTLIKRYSDRAVTISIERIQAQVLASFLGAKIGKLYSWTPWTSNRELQRRSPELIRLALDELHPELKDNKRPILLEGSLLAICPFRQSLLQALAYTSPVQLGDIKYYILHPGEEKISLQMNTRGAPHERFLANDLDEIRKRRNSYWELACRDVTSWEKVEEYSELCKIIEQRIDG